MSKPHSPSDFGTAEQRLVFLKHLRDRRLYTIEEIAKKSLYSQETVKSWFRSTNRRACHDRAIACLLNNLQMDNASYWSIVNKG